MINRKYALKMKRYFYSLRNMSYLCVTIYVFLVIIVFINKKSSLKIEKRKPPLFIVHRRTESISNESLLRHQNIVSEYLRYRNESWNTSQLGSYMFKFEKNYQKQKNKTFIVLIWTYKKWMQRCYKSKDRNRVLKDCPVKNCIFTNVERNISVADAVIFNLETEEYPIENRRRNQRWVFFSDDPEDHIKTATYNRKELHHLFNWSMTYRVESDIPIPFGRVIPHVRPLYDDVDLSKRKIRDDHYLFNMIPNWSSKQGKELIAINAINCNDRYIKDFLKLMNKLTPVRKHGNCAKKGKKDATKCLKRDSNCNELNGFLFYISADFSTCDNYFNENIFHHAFSKGAIPVIIGATEENVKPSLPPNSYLLVKDLYNPKSLAKTLTNLVKSNNKMLSHHIWRNNFRTSNQHGYFGPHYYDCCKICEALNFNSEEEKSYSYEDFMKFFDPNCTLHEF